MGPESLRSLGQRFWRVWLTGVAVATAAVIVGVVVVRPPNPLLVGCYGFFAVMFTGFGAISLTQGDRLDAAGTVTATVGWVVAGGSAAMGFPGVSLWVGVGLAGLGGTIGLVADNRHRIREAIVR